MDISANALRRETIGTLHQIEKQIVQVEEVSDELGIKPEKLRDAHGGWCLSSLLQAKAQCLNTLALLREK